VIPNRRAGQVARVAARNVVYRTAMKVHRISDRDEMQEVRPLMYIYIHWRVDEMDGERMRSFELEGCRRFL